MDELGCFLLDMLLSSGLARFILGAKNDVIMMGDGWIGDGWIGDSGAIVEQPVTKRYD